LRHIDYTQVAKRYAQSVVAGEIPACDLVKSVCQRALDEWEKQRWIYHYSPEDAARVCQFVELLPHIKGPLAGSNIKLEPWQVFILCQVFGWLKPDGTRRYRRAYIEIPRGNAKSTMSAAVALYMLCADGELGAEVYSFATTRDQARIVFDCAREMARRSPALQEAYGLTVEKHNLHIVANASKFEPKSSDADTLDGLNTHFACIDELHAHRTRDVYDVVETSLGKRNNNLLWCITTAGADQGGVCYELHKHAVHLIKGGQDDSETMFSMIYTVDADDDWTTEQALIKANPNWGISVMPDVIRSLQKKAMALPSAANAFKTKHLDMWVSARDSWLDMRAWEQCADRTMRMDDFIGQPCWIGLDLAERTDISCAAIVFRGIDSTGRDKYSVFVRHYLPRQTIMRGENKHYQGWFEQGHIVESGESATDQEIIRADLLSIAERHAVQAVLYDPAYASQLILRLQQDGFNCVVVRPSVLNLSDPMKLLEALVLERRLVHTGDPVLSWMAANVVAKRDEKDNIYPTKDSKSAKIDGIVAIITALTMASRGSETPASVGIYVV